MIDMTGIYCGVPRFLIRPYTALQIVLMAAAAATTAIAIAIIRCFAVFGLSNDVVIRPAELQQLLRG
jgi:hypothetical protein